MANYYYDFHEERGEYRGYVEDANGRDVWRVTYPDFYEDEESGELVESSTIFEDGYMKDATDIEGLEDYLKKIGVLKHGDELEFVDDEDDDDDDDDDEYSDGGEIEFEGRFQKNLKSLLQNEGWNISYYDQNINEVPQEKATELSIFRFEPYYENVTIKPLPKKITLEWVMNKVNKDKIYKSFADSFNKLLKKKGYENVNAYPTTYGIGVFVGFGYGISETKQSIENLLESH
jgi:hypothetical protein